jgi:hypothetical protein
MPMRTDGGLSVSERSACIAGVAHTVVLELEHLRTDLVDCRLPAIGDRRTRLLADWRWRCIILIGGRLAPLPGEVQANAYQNRRQEEPIRPVDVHLCRHCGDEIEDSPGKASAADGLASHNQIALHEPRA